MLFSLLLSKDDPLSNVISFLLTLPIVMLALSVHETAHGFVAWECGDSTAYNLGRLTLNPLRHLDPMGFIFMLIFGYGWAKPVPINTRNFRNPKNGMALSALAGPVSNLLLGLVCALLSGVCYGSFLHSVVAENIPEFLSQMLMWFYLAFQYGALINFLFALFNMIPVPPFDGSRILLIFLPPKIYFGLMRYERQILIGVLAVMFVFEFIFHFSPFPYLAENLTSKIVVPIGKAVFNALL